MLKGNRALSESGGVLKTVVVSVGVLAVLVVSVFAAIRYGSADLTYEAVVGVVASKLFGVQVEGLSPSSSQIVWNLRLPRALLAIATGGGLAVCGAAMQAITQNELADPYILGVSSGASAMASLAFFLGGVFSTTLVVQGFAFAGAIVSLVLVYAIGMSGGSAAPARIVLTGMAISIMMSAFSQLFITLSSVTTSRNIILWLMGSLAGARWETVLIPIVVSAAGLVFFLAKARDYNVISLGDEAAIGLGVDAARMKRLTGIVVALVSGVAVAACGVIGLVGFVVPHAVRIVMGSNHRRLFPLSFLAGSVFLVWMDLLARSAMSPQEVPIGIFTALCGGPFFVWLLYRQTRGLKGWGAS